MVGEVVVVVVRAWRDEGFGGFGVGFERRVGVLVLHFPGMAVAPANVDAYYETIFRADLGV